MEDFLSPTEGPAVCGVYHTLASELTAKAGAWDRDRFWLRPAESVKWESQSMHVRPLHDRLIIQRLDEGEQRVGGIIIPDSAKEKPQQGKVIAAGNGKSQDDGKRVPLEVKAGDTILFGKYSGQEIKLDGEDYIIMREDEVLGVIEGAHTKRKK
jgi:chaperonin GroES